MTAVRIVRAAARYGRRIEGFCLQSRWRTVVMCGAFGFLLAIASGIQPPSVHDEFSYVLAGDTFARGRLTNPTHPMWPHFETFHVIQRPTYASKYPPAQGLFLALGQRVFGSQGAGVWLSYALMIAALAWMLQGWVPPRWAFRGGIVAAIWLTGWHAFDGYWASTFWGGSVAATGGALVLGGARRLVRAPTAGASLAVGVGLALLANSRPFEGLFFVVAPMLVVSAALLAHARRRRLRNAISGSVPMLAVLVASGCLMAMYNSAVTGSPVEMPYKRYFNTYDSSPAIIGQAAPPMPEYRNAELEVFYKEGAGRTRAPELGEVPLWLWQNSGAVRRYYMPLIALPLLFAVPWALRGFWARVIFGSLAGITIAMSMTMYAWMPHYAAPAVGALALVYINCVRFLRQAHRRGIRFGRSLTNMVLVALCLSLALQLVTGRLPQNRQSWRWERERMQQRMAADGRHFVLVEYGPQHHENAEWVYNGADIDASPVVWARSLDPASDSSFIRYFADRRGWRLRVDNDEGPFELIPLNR